MNQLVNLNEDAQNSAIGITQPSQKTDTSIILDDLFVAKFFLLEGS